MLKLHNKQKLILLKLALKQEEKNLIASGDSNNSTNSPAQDASIQFYNLQLTKCKFEYYFDIESFWAKHKINNYYNINLHKNNSQTINNQESNQLPINNFSAENKSSENKSVDLIQEFSFYLRLEIGNDTKCNFDITQINVNINSYLANKLSALADVFKLDTKADIFESKFKTKNEIAKNSTKRGKVDLIKFADNENSINFVNKENLNIQNVKDNLNVNISEVKRFYCVLAGGFIYLFEKTENEFPDVTIPLKHLEFERLVDDEAKRFWLKLKLVIANKGKKDESKLFEEYCFAFDSVSVLDSWIAAINERKSLIQSFSEKISRIGILIN